MFKFLKEVSFLIPNFLDIQKSSFSFFFFILLIEEFQKKNPIINRKKKIKIIFFPKFYQFKTPNQNVYRSVINSKTYASGLYIPIHSKLFINS